MLNATTFPSRLMLSAFDTKIDICLVRESFSIDGCPVRGEASKVRVRVLFERISKQVRTGY